MDTILNPLFIPGWNQLLADHPTRARVLQALTNLELGHYMGQKPALPTRKTILAEAIRLGADISPTSQQTVQRHLDELAEAGHVIKVDKGKSPWRSRYLLLPVRMS
jgi:DNA-binding transcriptional ArsR family regulator